MPSSQPPRVEQSNPLLKWEITAGVVVAGLLIGFVAAWYYIARLSPEEAAGIAQTSVEEASTQFWQERNYEESIRTLTSAQDEASAAGPAAECSVKIELASKNLREHQTEAMRLYAEIYNNDAYPLKCRAGALTDMMWHVSSHIGDGSLDVQTVREHVFIPGRFAEVLPPGTKLETDKDVTRATVIGFEKSYELYPSYVSGMAAAHYYSFYLPSNRKLWKSDNQYVVNMRKAYERSLPLLEEARTSSEEQNRFSHSVLYALHNAASGPAFGFALASMKPKSEFYAASKQTIAYASRFQDASFLAPVFRALMAHRYACGMVLLEKRPLTESQKQELRDVLKYIYTLPKEDLANRKRWRVWADQPTHICHEPTVYIANEIDPRLKKVLIEEVGGWTEEHFE